jgi:hypothetical protein
LRISVRRVALPETSTASNSSASWGVRIYGTRGYTIELSGTMHRKG